MCILRQLTILTRTITPDLFFMLDVNLNRLVESGRFRIMIGAFSVDIRLRGFIEVVSEGTQ